MSRTRSPRGAALGVAPELMTKAGDLRKRLPVCTVRGSSGHLYRIAICDGQWQCACPAWTRHTPRSDCKHIMPVKVALRRLADREGCGHLTGDSINMVEPVLAAFLDRHIDPTTGPKDDPGYAFLALLPLVENDPETTMSAWRAVMQMVYDDNTVVNGGQL